MRTCPDNYVDSMVTDPPAGIAFMPGKADWDCFRRRHNPKDVGRENVFGRTSEHAPHSYGESERGNFIAFMTEVMKESWRVVKPGGHAFVWALPRTSHWTAMALEDAGWEIRTVVHHHFGSGFPKSADISKALDRMAGAERKTVVGYGRGGAALAFAGDNPRPWHARQVATGGVYAHTAPETESARDWEGFGTAIKPATEHWILCRKPLSESSIARNVLKHSTGSLNIDACRVHRDADDVPGWHESGAKGSKGYQGEDTFKIHDMSPEEIQERCGDKGRWPPDLLLSHSADCKEACSADCPVAELDRQSGATKSSGKTRKGSGETKSGSVSQGGGLMADLSFTDYGDFGGASRFFPTFRYQAKPSRSEREVGCEDLPTAVLNRVNPGGLENEPRFAPIKVKNNHPTPKGIELARWLSRLITPPGGMILDPFAGSGSLGCGALLEGFRWVGIEQNEDYCAIPRARLRYWDVKCQCEKS